MQVARPPIRNIPIVLCKDGNEVLAVSVESTTVLFITSIAMKTDTGMDGWEITPMLIQKKKGQGQGREDRTARRARCRFIPPPARTAFRSSVAAPE